MLPFVCIPYLSDRASWMGFVGWTEMRYMGDASALYTFRLECALTASLISTFNLNQTNND